jgi:hypothetical protein
MEQVNRIAVGGERTRHPLHAGPIKDHPSRTVEHNDRPPRSRPDRRITISPDLSTSAFKKQPLRTRRRTARRRRLQRTGQSQKQPNHTRRNNPSIHSGPSPIEHERLTFRENRSVSFFAEFHSPPVQDGGDRFLRPGQPLSGTINRMETAVTKLLRGASEQKHPSAILYSQSS